MLGAAVVGVAPSPITGLEPAAAYPASSVQLVGHGYGHGRGMGQYGALGYAIDEGWTYHQILDHYYGGTTRGSIPTSTLMTVDMTSRDGLDTIVVQERGGLTTSPNLPLGCTTGTPCAVRIERTGPQTFRVWHASTCAGGPNGWTLVTNAVSATTITVAPTQPTSDARQDMLQVCEANDVRWLQGDLLAVDTGSSQATVNQLPIDSYVRGVVPRESPASWGALGNGQGEQELDAQAVASRSYAEAESRWPYAKTCDTTACQVYGGRSIQTNDGTFEDLEGTPAYSYSDEAVANTAGEVRVFTSTGGGPAGTVARTEFSSSTGGYTAGGTFPAVLDAGDATASNPNHTWTTSIPVSDIESAFGQGLGTLVAIDVTARNGLGDWGGRVRSLALTFTGGDVSLYAYRFVEAFGLRSDWFQITNNATLPYQVLTADGTVYGFGGATSARVLGQPSPSGAAAIGSTSTSTGTNTSTSTGTGTSTGTAGTASVSALGLTEAPEGGYWVLTSDGNVHAYEGAGSYGSVAGTHLNGPPRQILATHSGHGYWIMASDGGVFTFGDARFFGSTGNRRLNAPIVGMGVTPDDGGYWLLGSDGGIFSFGDARFFGSTGGMRLNAPVNAMAATPDGSGYWLFAADGGVFSFGSAHFAGSLPGIGVRATAAAAQPSPTGQGYLVATAPGRVYGFGDAIAQGGPADSGATAPTVALALTR